MSLIDELYEEVSGRLHGQQIAGVRIGLGYSAVLRDQVQQLFVFDCQERQECPTLLDSAAPSLLPRCDVVILSATTLLNHTLERLLDCSRGARELVVLGPSSPLVPAPFAKRGVTLLSGVVVEKPDKLLRIVSEGGGTRQFGDAVRKLSIRCREAPRPEPSCGTSDRRAGI
jgi:uncharacterized protein (DUF4213/DUF364 family)